MFATSQYDILMKTVVIGDSGVGKSSLIHRYSENDWNPTYIATIGVDFKVDTFEHDGKVVKLTIWDTAGQERFKTICSSYYRGAHSVVIVFDVTNRESFDHIKGWLKEVEMHARPNTPTMILGNKTDMPGRVVSTEEAKSYADLLNMTYAETSAKTADNVTEAFRGMVKATLADQLQNTPLAEDTAKSARIRQLASSADNVKRETCIERFLSRFGLS